MRRSDLTLGKIALEKVVLFEEFELQWALGIVALESVGWWFALRLDNL